MPTLPENAGLSFGADARRYDRARPGYPRELIDRILAQAPGPSVLDVGCGTGKVAAQLRAAGAGVLGVEADPRMAGVAREAGLDVEVAKFEDWDPHGRRFDAVVSGQTWHWIDPARGAAKAAGVTRAGGLFTVFWNAAQPPEPLGAQMLAIYARLLPGTPVARQSQGSVADGYAGLGAKALRHLGDAFGELQDWRFPWQQYYTREQWLETVPTFGGQSQVAPEVMAELLEAIGEAVGDGFTMDYTTVALAAIRNG